ncbi:MAG: hypothetical protein ACI9MR_003723, partial [Myxococcota bacterium]
PNATGDDTSSLRFGVIRNFDQTGRLQSRVIK